MLFRSVITAAEEKAKMIVSRAEESRDTARREAEEAKNDAKERKTEITQSEERLVEKEKRIEAKSEEIDQKKETLLEKEKVLEGKLDAADQKSRALEGKLEEMAKLSQEDARAELMQYTEERYEKDILGLLEKKKKDLKSREADAAREIIIKSIQQYA